MVAVCFGVFTGVAAMNEAFAIAGLSASDQRHIRDILGRMPTLTEQGLFTAMWSEHCSYRSSRDYLSRLPSRGSSVVAGAGENAGVVDIGDGWCCVFKIESHNHPSYIEPYQGAATAVGGILRDIFTMGARPVANLNALRFGDPGQVRTRYLVDGVVRGLADYGNSIGVPMVGGELGFDRSYNGNILVNAMSVGIVRREALLTSRCREVGARVLYVGARTGRDGIHGAAMASASFADQVESHRPAVQIGDPFAGKCLMEACLEAAASGRILAMQDMGAAGLTSSSVEMAAHGGLGMRLDLDCVPLREIGLRADQIMLSESQERMLILLHEDDIAAVAAIFHREGLTAAVIGTTTADQHLRIDHQGTEVASVPIAALVEAPSVARPCQPVAESAPTPERARMPEREETPPTAEKEEAPVAVMPTLLRLLGSPELVSRRWIYQQYDATVMADNCARPGGDAAIIRVHGTDKRLAMTVDATPRYCRLDARLGAQQAVAEAWRNVSAVGAKPLALTNCLNFGNPERAEVMGTFAATIDGLSEAARAFDLAVISGNVSFYNETGDRSIDPTPVIGLVGLLDATMPLVGIAPPADDLALVLLGGDGGHLEASLYAAIIDGDSGGLPPPVDFAAEMALSAWLCALIRDGRACAVHDVSDGGVLIAVAEMALSGQIGVRLDAAPAGLDPRGFWFGEDQGRYVIALAAGMVPALLAEADAIGIMARPIGHFGGGDFCIGTREAAPMTELTAIHEGWLPDFMSPTHRR